jgi:hypothetical protein
MRQITRESIHAFLKGKYFSKANMSVIVYDTTHGYRSIMRLHNNPIAKLDIDAETNHCHNLWITNAGWSSNTTKERLNGLPGVSIVQRNFQWYLNGQPWDGSWKQIGAQK